MEENIRKEPTADASPPLSTLLEGLLSNPDLTKRMGEMLRSMPSAESAATSSSTSASADAALRIPSAINQDGLASVLSDPALMEKLPQIMAMMKPMLASLPAQSAAQSDASPATRSHLSDRDRLLLSLKPFLSRERQEAVESILRIAQLGSLLKHLK